MYSTYLVVSVLIQASKALGSIDGKQKTIKLVLGDLRIVAHSISFH